MASDLSVPAATASSSGRSKIALKPGRSLMDWIRLTHSGKDLTSVGGKSLEVSPRELAKHNTKKDAWISLRGRVYNITPYLEYHPGGEDELMRGVGKDATDLFNEIHKWVNAESMLEKCFVGYLKKSWSFDVPKLPTLKTLKLRNKPASESSAKVQSDASEANCEESLIIPKNSNSEVDAARIDTKNLPKVEDDLHKTAICKSEWTVTPSAEIDKPGDLIRLEGDGDVAKLKIKHSNEKHHGLITDLVDRKLFLKISCASTYIFNIEFPAEVKDNYKVNAVDEQAIDISFQTCDTDQTSSPSFLQRVHWTLCKPKDELVYWSCTMVGKASINYNTSLFTFQLPYGVKMWVPIGQHVQIKSSIEGMEIVRSYTPVTLIPNSSYKDSDENDGSRIFLMIKIYPKGSITPIINRCNIGDNILISNYIGSFSETLLNTCDSVTMLAAGTGITPMIKIINWIMNAKDKRRSMLLLFFNKKEEDILWRNELKSCSSTYNEFRIVDILSEPSKEWSGTVGQINADLLGQLLDAKVPNTRHQVFVCGPLPFTETAFKCLEETGCSRDDVYAFTGT